MSVPVPEQKYECPSGEINIASAYDPKNCVGYYSSNVCLKKKNGFTWALSLQEKEIFESCLILPQNESAARGSFNTPQPQIFLNVSLEQKLRFAKWADKNNDHILSIKPWSTYGLFGEQIYIGEVKNTPTILGVLDPQLMPSAHSPQVPHLTWPLAPKYFASVDDFIAFKEKASIKSVPSFEEASEDIKILLEINQKANSQAGSIKTFSEEVCLDTCITISEPIPLNDSEAVYREYYSLGERYRSEWLLYKAKSVVAMLYLTDRWPSLAIEIKRDDHGRASRITVANRLGKELYQRVEDTDSEDLLMERAAIRSNRTLAPVGLCEEEQHWIYFQNQDIGRSLLIGPHINQSFYGWSDNSGQTDLYWLGREHRNEIGLKLNPQDLSKHSFETAYLLAKKGDIGVVPLGTDGCLRSEHVKTWWPTFKQQGGKVLSLSAVSFESKKMCQKMFSKHPIMTDKGSALWVFSAGNRSESEAHFCPQYLTNQENVMLVGASYENQVHHKSSRGIDFVDIFTSGNSELSQSWGTSYAAPRVARVAALISKSFPHFSPFEVKVSIMLSAKIPEWYELPARSRGLLDESAAMKFSKSLNSNGGNIYSTIADHHCYVWQSSCDESERRVRIYHEILKGVE